MSNRNRIYNMITDADVLIGLACQELAYSLLQVAKSNLQNGIVHREVIISIDPIVPNPDPYQGKNKNEIQMSLIEALHWLEVNGILLPAPGTNGNNGFRFISRKGNELIDRDQFDSFQKAAEFPKSLLHPKIADQIWLSLARNDLSGAVFYAFRAVEESVRSAGNFKPTDVGVDLMRRAFNPESGPLTDKSVPVAERESLMHLFAGSIGSYKNPHSHRTITIEDHQEAQEMCMLASHLLRIAEARNENN